MKIAAHIITGTVAISIGIVAGYTYQKSKTDLVEHKMASLVRAMDEQTVIARREVVTLKDRYTRVQDEANARYEKELNALSDDIERMRDERDSARARALSAVAERTASAGKLCYTRKGFDSALRRLDEGLSALVGECGDVERRLEVTREWWNEITTSPPQRGGDSCLGGVLLYPSKDSNVYFHSSCETFS